MTRFTKGGQEMAAAWWRSAAPKINALLGAPPERPITLHGESIYAADGLVAEISGHVAPRGTAYGYAEGIEPDRLRLKLWGDCDFPGDEPDRLMMTNRGVPFVTAT